LRLTTRTFSTIDALPPCTCDRLVDSGLERRCGPAPVAAVAVTITFDTTVDDAGGRAPSARSRRRPTVCGAPIRAQASIAITVSRIIGM
jgi:hypothetical protein